MDKPLVYVLVLYPLRDTIILHLFLKYLLLMEIITWPTQCHFSIFKMKLKGEKVTEDAGTSRCNLFFTTQYCQTTSPLALPHWAHSCLRDKWTGCPTLPYPAYPTLPYPFYFPVTVPTATASAQRVCLDGKLLVVGAFWYVTNRCDILTRFIFAYLTQN